MKLNIQQPKTYGTHEGSPEREVHSDTGLPKGGRKSQINNITFHLQKLEEQ